MTLASGFQIRENKVLKLEVTVNPKYESTQCCTEFSMTCATQHHSNVVNEKQAAKIECCIKIELFRDPDKKKKYVTVDVKDIGIFEAPSELSKDDFDRMLHLNGLTTMLPIIRGIVFNITSSLNIRSSVLIPNINVTKMTWEKLEATKPD